MNIQDKCAEVYAIVRNLKLTGLEVGIPWQTVYIHLENKGVQVIGNKARYSSASDRVGIIVELLFKKSVPFTIDNNESKFQSNINFIIDKSTANVKVPRVHPVKRNNKGEIDTEK